MDLRNAGIGSGDHGFEIYLTDTTLSRLDIENLYVTASSRSEEIKLPALEFAPTNIVELTAPTCDPITDPHQFPAFILGPARSGTSAVALGLLHSQHFEGSGEGHLLSLAHALLGVVDHHYGKYGRVDVDATINRVDVHAFQALIRRTFIRLTRDLYPTGYWIDKTPTVEMVRAAPLMLELWPNARFVFLKRRVIENVLSRRRKFPYDTTEAHYSDWAAVMESWLSVRGQLRSRSLEIEQRDLEVNCDIVVPQLSSFLQLPDSAMERLRNYLSTQRPERTDNSTSTTYEINDLRITSEEEWALRTRCDAVMQAFEYSYCSSYRQRP
jgi:hypothetical protein